MREHSSVHRALVDKINRLPGKIIQSVEIHRLCADRDLLPRLLDIENRLEHHSRTVLNELPHGMKIRRQIDARGEQTLLILALRLAKELLPPL